uniref:Envelope glycoprotein n=1 Tax=Equus caballus TaxID=9796 RepID=A0A9L0TU97_HORSE
MAQVPPCAAVKTSSAIRFWRTALRIWDTSKSSSERLCCVSFKAFIVNLFRASMCQMTLSIPNWGRKIEATWSYQRKTERVQRCCRLGRLAGGDIVNVVLPCIQTKPRVHRPIHPGGRTTFTISPPANLPNQQQRWTCSVFHWYDHVASIFLPQLGIESVICHMEALNKFTMKALNDTQHSLSLLDLEVSQMRKAVLQNRMALDVLTAAQGGTCAIIKTECCVYIPDYHQNISGFLSDMSHQIKSMSDPPLSLNDWLNSWSGPGFWTAIKTLFIGLIILLVFLIIICCLFRCLSSACQQSFTSWTTTRQMILSSPEALDALSALDSTGAVFRNTS